MPAKEGKDIDNLKPRKNAKKHSQEEETMAYLNRMISLLFILIPSMSFAGVTLTDIHPSEVRLGHKVNWGTFFELSNTEIKCAHLQVWIKDKSGSTVSYDYMDILSDGSYKLEGSFNAAKEGFFSYTRKARIGLCDGYVFTNNSSEWVNEKTWKISVVNNSSSGNNLSYDVSVSNNTFGSPETNKETCGYISLYNRGSNPYLIDEVTLSAEGVAVSWRDKSDNGNFKLSSDDKDEVGSFCFTPHTAGPLTLNVRVTLDDGTSDKVDSIELTVNDAYNAHDHKACFGNNIYWYDFNGNRTDLVQTCASNTAHSNWIYYCSGNLLKKKRQATTFGCSSASCGVVKDGMEEQAVKDCVNLPPICTADNGGGYYSGGYCDSTKNQCLYTDFTACEYGCGNGECIPYNPCLEEVCLDGDLYCRDSDNILQLNEDCDDIQGCDNKIGSCNPPCKSKWECSGFSPCESIGDSDAYAQTRICQDLNNCLVPVNKPVETMLCGEPGDCHYISIEWEGPLHVGDTDPAYFTVKWEGDCRYDRRSIFLEEVTWRNGPYGPAPIEIDMQGQQPYGGQESYEIKAFFVDHPFDAPKFKVILADSWIDSTGRMQRVDIIESNNLLRVDKWSKQAPLEEYVRRAQALSLCNDSSTITAECLKYWEEMKVDISWEYRQLETVFDILDAIWKGSCAACVVSSGVSSAWMVLETTIAIDTIPPLLFAEGVACGICVGGDIGPFEVEMVAEHLIKVKVASRVSELEKVGILEHATLTGERTGAITYVDNGVKVTEIYGISPLGTESLTFTKKIPNFPGALEGSYALIDIHRNLVPLDLSKIQGLGLSAIPKAATAEDNFRALIAMNDQGQFVDEANFLWQILTNGKIPLRGSVKLIKVVPEQELVGTLMEGAYAVWSPQSKTITLVAKSGGMTTASGKIISRSEAALYHALPHEFSHASFDNLIEVFRNPEDNAYHLRLAPPRGDPYDTYWVNEMFTDVIYRYTIQGDKFRLERYMDGAYGLIHDIGTDKFVQKTLQLAEEKRFYPVHYRYNLAEMGDSAVAKTLSEGLKAKLGEEGFNKFLAIHQEMEMDAIKFYEGMVLSSGFDATREMDHILRWYHFVEDGMGRSDMLRSVHWNSKYARSTASDDTYNVFECTDEVKEINERCHATQLPAGERSVECEGGMTATVRWDKAVKYCPLTSDNNCYIDYGPEDILECEASYGGEIYCATAGGCSIDDPCRILQTHCDDWQWFPDYVDNQNKREPSGCSLTPKSQSRTSGFAVLASLLLLALLALFFFLARGRGERP